MSLLELISGVNPSLIVEESNTTVRSLGKNVENIATDEDVNESVQNTVSETNSTIRNTSNNVRRIINNYTVFQTVALLGIVYIVTGGVVKINTNFSDNVNTGIKNGQEVAKEVVKEGSKVASKVLDSVDKNPKLAKEILDKGSDLISGQAEVDTIVNPVKDITSGIVKIDTK